MIKLSFLYSANFLHPFSWFLESLDGIMGEQFEYNAVPKEFNAVSKGSNAVSKWFNAISK